MELKCRNLQHFCRDSNGLTVAKSGDASLRDERQFWDMMTKGLCDVPAELWYGSELVLEDLNSTGNRAKPYRKKNCTRRIIEPSNDNHFIVPKSSGTVTPRNTIQAAAKFCNIYDVNQVRPLHHLKPIPGFNCRMFYIRGAITFFPFQVKDENLSSISFLCDGAAEIWYFESFLPSV